MPPRSPANDNQPYEVQITIAVADALRVACTVGWLWTHFPAGEHRNSKTGARLKRMGLQRGWFDFCLIDLVGNHYWLELKRGMQPLTEDQVTFAEQLQVRAVAWAVARSFKEAVEVLSDWGALDGLRIAA